MSAIIVIDAFWGDSGKGKLAAYLAAPTDAAWETFTAAYVDLLSERFAADRTPFDEIAGLAGQGDVCIGCSCPTRTTTSSTSTPR